MVHNLDITNGTVSFADAREDAWHQLGQSGLGKMTAQQALDAAYLARWNVRKRPAFYQTEDGLFLPMRERFAVVRDNPVTGAPDFLGDVGSRYNIIQNEEHVAFLDALVSESGAHFETAGAIEGGATVFITMKLPGHIQVGGADPVDTYIVAINRHDGSGSFTVIVTPVRVVCQNTLNLAMGEATNVFRIRHTKGATGAVQEARETLDMTFSYLGEFQEIADRMIDTEMTQARFEEIIRKEFGPEEDAAPATITRAQNKISEMERLFADACTQENICHTAWAGFNALTEWFDHYAPVRGDDRTATRAANAVLDTKFKARALALMSS